MEILLRRDRMFWITSGPGQSGIDNIQRVGKWPSWSWWWWWWFSSNFLSGSILDGYTLMLILFMCILSSKHHFISYAYSLKMHPHIGHRLSATTEWLRLVLFYTHLDFLVHFLFSVLEAGCFELFLIITNCLNTLSVGWSSKEYFLSNRFHFPAVIVKKSPKCQENSSHSFAAVPNSPKQSQPHIFVTIGSLALLY